MSYSHFVAGCAGGISGVIVGYPFDTIRVNLQTQKGYSKYTGSIDCFKKIIKFQGMRGLYKGVTSPFLGVTIYKTLNFGVYGNIINRIEDPKIYHIMIAGTIAAQISGLVLVPMERLKILSQTNKYNNPIHVLKNIQLNNILKQGFAATIMRETAFGISYFPSFLYCKKLLNYTGSNSHVDFAKLVFSGGMTGAISWTIAYPIDVIKSKIQNKECKNTNTLHTFIKHYKKEGLSGFYKGWRVAVVRAFPTHATVLGVFQYVHNRLNKV